MHYTAVIIGCIVLYIIRCLEFVVVRISLHFTHWLLGPPTVFGGKFCQISLASLQNFTAQGLFGKMFQICSSSWRFTCEWTELHSLQKLQFLCATAATAVAHLSRRNSVHLSICLFVMWVDQSKTMQARVTKFSPLAVWKLSLIHIWRCRRIERCRSRWSPYH